MASFLVLVIGVLVGVVFQHQFKLVERVGARLDKWLSKD